MNGPARYVLDFRELCPWNLLPEVVALSDDERALAVSALHRFVPLKMPRLVLVSHDDEPLIHLPPKGQHHVIDGAAAGDDGVSSSLRQLRMRIEKDDGFAVVTATVRFPIAHGGWAFANRHLADALITLSASGPTCVLKNSKISWPENVFQENQ